MSTIILAALLTLAPLVAHAGGPARCTTRWDEGFQIYRTECSDGARAVSRWDAGLQRWQTDITKPPQGDKPPRAWPRPSR
jgi:hypothetical protein